MAEFREWCLDKDIRKSYFEEGWGITKSVVKGLFPEKNRREQESFLTLTLESG